MCLGIKLEPLKKKYNLFFTNPSSFTNTTIAWPPHHLSTQNCLRFSIACQVFYVASGFWQPPSQPVVVEEELTEKKDEQGSEEENADNE